MYHRTLPAVSGSCLEGHILPFHMWLPAELCSGLVKCRKWQHSFQADSCLKSDASTSSHPAASDRSWGGFSASCRFGAPTAPNPWWFIGRSEPQWTFIKPVMPRSTGDKYSPLYLCRQTTQSMRDCTWSFLHIAVFRICFVALSPDSSDVSLLLAIPCREF